MATLKFWNCLESSGDGFNLLNECIDSFSVGVGDSPLEVVE